MSPKTGPQQQRAILTRERIIRAAGEEFATHGYPDARIPRLSLAAGVSSGAVTFHFKKKRDLALAVCEQYVAIMADALGAAPSNGTSGIVDAYVHLAELFSGSPIVQAGFRLHAESASALGLDAASPQLSLTTHTLRLLQAAQQQGNIPKDADLRDLAESLTDTFAGSYIQYKAMSGGTDFPDRIARMLDTMLPKPRIP